MSTYRAAAGRSPSGRQPVAERKSRASSRLNLRFDLGGLLGMAGT